MNAKDDIVLKGLRANGMLCWKPQDGKLERADENEHLTDENAHLFDENAHLSDKNVHLNVEKRTMDRRKRILDRRKLIVTMKLYTFPLLAVVLSTLFVTTDAATAQAIRQ